MISAELGQFIQITTIPYKNKLPKKGKKER